MCDLADGFKLCTCDPESLVEPDWMLSRHDPGRPTYTRRGRVAPPRFTPRDEAQIAVVVDALNRGACFDFDFEPVDGDVLVLRDVGSTFLRFRRGPRGWRHDVSTSFTPWRQQMVLHAQGALQLPDDQPAPGEAELLEGIEAHPADAGRRLVAADWLREQGRTVLAEWLRLEARAASGEAVAGFRAVAEKLGRRLRARLARAPIQGCVTPSCPGDWVRLTRGLDPVARTCPECSVTVCFADSTQRRHGPHVQAPSLERPP